MYEWYRSLFELVMALKKYVWRSDRIECFTQFLNGNLDCVFENTFSIPGKWKISKYKFSNFDVTDIRDKK